MLLADIVTGLEDMLGVLTTDGFGPLQQAYTDNWLHTGQQVCVVFGILASGCH